jgi:predicted enzyme involved in methoxymalonyl-ACP biosynthesis
MYYTGKTEERKGAVHPNRIVDAVCDYFEIAEMEIDTLKPKEYKDTVVGFIMYFVCLYGSALLDDYCENTGFSVFDARELVSRTGKMIWDCEQPAHEAAHDAIKEAITQNR